MNVQSDLTRDTQLIKKQDSISQKDRRECGGAAIWRGFSAAFLSP